MGTEGTTAVMDEVRNFLDHDKALCAQALDRNSALLLRAAEMLAAVQAQEEQA